MADINLHEKCTKKQRLWAVHIRACKKSGLSQNEYCRRNQLNSNQFCYWKKKLAQQEKASVIFAPVPVPGREASAEFSSSGSGLTVLLRNGIKIVLGNEFSSAALSKAATALGGPV